MRALQGMPVSGLVANTTLGYERDTPLRAPSDDARELARQPRLLAEAYLALPGLRRNWFRPSQSRI